MKLATWNVNGIRARHAQVLEWIQLEQPDVVGLQEIKATCDQVPVGICELEWVLVLLARRRPRLFRSRIAREKGLFAETAAVFPSRISISKIGWSSRKPTTSP
jgi:exodeoxyribonuclease-3